ncbi:MAG TPA: DUF488 family protein [Ktedonobacteraceae bacterium]
MSRRTSADTAPAGAGGERLNRHTTGNPVERGTIYTLGYSQRNAAATLERLMRHPRTLLVDVRYQPVVSGWNPQWNRASLAGRYGERYVWERRLGTLQSRGRDVPIQLAPGSQHAIEEAVGLLCAGTSLVLLCACAHERACHRSSVAKLIQDGLPVPRVAQEVWT